MDEDLKQRLRILIYVSEWAYFTGKYYKEFEKICPFSCQVPTGEKIPRVVVNVPRKRYKGFSCMLLAHNEKLSNKLQLWVFKSEEAGIFCCVANTWQEYRDQVFGYLGKSLHDPSLRQEGIERVILEYEKKLEQESDSKFCKLADFFFSNSKTASHSPSKSSPPSRNGTIAFNRQSKYFKIPTELKDPKLVAVMMPFGNGFDQTYRTIEQTIRKWIQMHEVR